MITSICFAGFYEVPGTDLILASGTKQQTRLVHDQRGFTVICENTEFPIERYNMCKMLRSFSPEQLETFCEKSDSYFVLSGVGKDATLSAYLRMRGGINSTQIAGAALSVAGGFLCGGPVGAALVTTALVAAESANQKNFRDQFELARQGDTNAQYDLGKLYEKGDGTSKNINSAKEWYRKAAAKGHAKAIAALERLG